VVVIIDMTDILLFMLLLVHALVANNYYFVEGLFSKLGLCIILCLIYIYVTFVIFYSSLYLMVLIVVLLVDFVFLYGYVNGIKHFLNNGVTYFNITMALMLSPLIQPTFLFLINEI